MSVLASNHSAENKVSKSYLPLFKFNLILEKNTDMIFNKLMQVLHEMTLVGIKSVFHATEEPGWLYKILRTDPWSMFIKSVV